MSVKRIKPHTVKASRLYGDYLLMLILPAAVAVFNYGVRALIVILAGVAGALLSDLIMSFIIKKEFLLKDLSNVFIGAVIALMLPAGVPFYVPFISAVFALIAVKIPFGGSLRAPFVPAAAGFAFASVCFKEQVFDYSYNTAGKMLGSNSLGSLLAQGNAVRLNMPNAFDILIGNVAGPMGTGCILLMLACFAFLLIRKKGSLFTVVSFICSCALYAALFPRVNASAGASIVLEFCSGSLLFAAVFLLTDYATQPQRVSVRIIHGAMCGFLCMMMRNIGTYEETVCFAILLANAITPVIDSALKKRSSEKTAKNEEAAK